MIFKDTKKLFVNRKRPVEFYSIVEFKTGKIYAGRKVPTINVFFTVNGIEVLAKGKLDLQEFQNFLEDNNITEDDNIASMKNLNKTSLTKFSFKVKQGNIAVKYNNKINETMSSNLDYKDAKVELFRGKEIDGLDYTGSKFIEEIENNEEDSELE